MDENGLVKTVVIKKEYSNAVSPNLLYIRNVCGMMIDENNSRVYEYQVDRMNANGELEAEETIYADRSLDAGTFASYTLVSRDNEFTPFYQLRAYRTAQGEAISVNSSAVVKTIEENGSIVVEAFGDEPNVAAAEDGEAYRLHVGNAVFVNTQNSGINSFNDLADAVSIEKKAVELKFIYNDDKDSKNFRDVSMVVITSVKAVDTGLLYILDYLGRTGIDENGNTIHGYIAAKMTSDGLMEEEEIYADSKLSAGSFASYTSSSRNGFAPFYMLRLYDVQNQTISVNGAVVNEVISRDMVRLGGYTKPTNLSSTEGFENLENTVSMRRSEWLDLTGNNINSVDNLKDFIDNDQYPMIQMIYNDNPAHDSFRTVSLVIVCGFRDTKADAPDAEAETAGIPETSPAGNTETPA